VLNVNVRMHKAKGQVQSPGTTGFLLLTVNLFWWIILCDMNYYCLLYSFVLSDS